MICLWAGNLTPPPTPFTLIGNVVPIQLTRGRDVWPQMVHFCLGLTVIRILINFDLYIIRKQQMDIFNTRLKSIVINQNLSINIKNRWKSIGQVFVIIDFCN